MNVQLRRVAALLAVAILIASVPFTASAAQTTTVVPATLVTTGVTFADLTCVTFPSASVGYAAGSDGTIVRTTNGGATWAEVKTGGGQAFVGIAFWDATSGIAVTSDRQVWRTTTGTSWSQINPDITANAGGTPQIKVNDVDSVPGTTDRAALAAGDDPITSDENWYGEQLWLTWGSGAVYWGSQPVYESKSYLWDPEYGDTAWVGEGEFFDVDFVDGSNGWAVGADYYSGTTTSTIARTTNGGQNWSKQYLGTAATLKAVSFASTLVGVTTSADGRAFYTTDGGTSWTAGASGVTVSLNGVVMLDALNGYAVGNGGTVIKTTNGGVTWGPEVSGTTQDLLAVTAVNSTTAVAVGRAGTVVLLGATTDTTGPTMTSLTSSTHPSSTTWYSNNDPAFSWGANDPSGVAGYSYELDQLLTTDPDMTSEGAGTTTSFTDKADGTWYFHVRAVDSLGNWGDTSHLAVKIDTTAPSVISLVSSSHPVETTWYSSNDPAFSWSPSDASSGVVGYSYVLDQSAATLPGTTSAGPGTSASFADKADGVWYFHVRALDAGGNWGTAVHREVRIDTTGPLMTSVSSATHPSPSTWYSNNDPAFSWGANDPSGVAGYSYELDQLLTTDPDMTSEGAGTTTSFTDKADGTWYFHVRAVDSLGNWGDTSHLAVKIDTAPPVTTDDHDAVYTAPATITLTPGDTHSGVAATYYALDGTPGTGTTVNTSVAGDHTLEYASVDVAGNRETSVTVDFTIDLTAPSIVSLESSTHPLETTWYANNDPAFSWGASDPGNVAGYSYELGQSASTVPDETSEGTGAMASFTDKADGTWYFHVRAVNAYGTWGSTSHLQVRIDTTPPLTTAEAVTAPGSGTVTLSSFDPDPGSGLAGISWSVADGASGVGNTVTLTGAGTYTVNYWAVDIAGNEETHRSIEVVVPPVVPTELIVTPIAGANRIDTAIIASQEAFPTGATTVVIATGFNWPDALGGAALAGALDAPILLTDPTTLSSAVSVEITRLGASKAVILGGTGAVSTAVENALKSNLGTSNVARVAGANRYETARKIAEATVAEVGAGYDGTAFVATGANFPDALGASPLAAANGWPIYLVDPRGVDSALVASMQSIGVTDAIMLGGTGAVSITIESDLWNDVPCATTRLAGTDRYDTARVVATYGVTDAGLGWDKVAIATGLNFPDALAGGVLQGRTGSVMLLTPGTSLYPGVASTLTANKSEVFEVRFLGGLGAVNQSVRDAVVAALQ